MERKYIAVIPAYEPDERLVSLVQEAKENGFYVVVVDDGSGDQYREIFEKAASQAKVLSYPENKGKGYAMKTGFSYIRENPEDFQKAPAEQENTQLQHLHHLHQATAEGRMEASFTARFENKTTEIGMEHTEAEPTVSSEDLIIVVLDCDGQHTVSDALRLCEKASVEPETLWLGSRKQSASSPLRSRIGNGITRNVFRLLSGVKVYDTQTGMRAFSEQLLPRILEVPGDRYEYEMNMLMQFAREKIPMKEMEIETIYIDNNSGSHFSTIKDSWRIYKDLIRQWVKTSKNHNRSSFKDCNGHTAISSFKSSFKSFIKFSGISCFSFFLDYALFSVFTGIIGPAGLIYSNIAARLISGTVNYQMNRRLVFSDKRNISQSAFQYFLLASGILAANSLLLWILTGIIGINVFAAKIIVEVLLFIVSFLVQKLFIFNPGKVAVE